jgi:hypothetical protein
LPYRQLWPFRTPAFIPLQRSTVLKLEKRLADLQKAEQALNQSEAGRRVSEDKFQKIFHSGPIAFSITTLEEGRFLEVNAARTGIYV